MIQKTNLKDIVNLVDDLFLYKRVGTLNNHMLNVLQAENRTLDFHIHESSDEMFYCIEGEFDIEVDSVIMSLGTSPNPLIKNTTAGLETQKWGGIIVEEETGLTSREGVYAGGDAVTGAATVILAMGAGKTAADAIDKKLSAK